MTCYRCRSISRRSLKGRPVIEVPEITGPVRSDERRVSIFKLWLDSKFPFNDNRIQTIVAPDGLIAVSD